MHLLFVSGQEIIIVLAIALIFFGAKSIPEIARMMGKGAREFRKATNEIQREFDESTSDIRSDIKKVNKSIQESADKAKEDFDQISKQATSKKEQEKN